MGWYRKKSFVRKARRKGMVSALELAEVKAKIFSLLGIL
jgi:hypothetical protein